MTPSETGSNVRLRRLPMPLTRSYSTSLARTLVVPGVQEDGVGQSKRSIVGWCDVWHNDGAPIRGVLRTTSGVILKAVIMSTAPSHQSVLTFHFAAFATSCGGKAAAPKAASAAVRDGSAA